MMLPGRTFTETPVRFPEPPAVSKTGKVKDWRRLHPAAKKNRKAPK